MSEPIKIAAVQMDVELGQVERNVARITDFLKQTAGAGAKIVVFPECVLPGYCFESLEEAMPFAEPVPGPSTERLSRLCKELGVHAVVGMLESDEDRLFNSAVLIGPGGVVAGYRKVHLPYLGIDRFTTPGDRPFDASPAGDLRIGMNICYDGAFPEASRIMALRGADLIALPTNWPPGSELIAEHGINTRAMENNVYYIAVNRVGTERGFRFIGKSRICGPNGATLADAPHDREEILYAEVDVARARNKHIVRVPGKHEIDRFADRRPDMYGGVVDPVQPES